MNIKEIDKAKEKNSIIRLCFMQNALKKMLMIVDNIICI